MVLSNVNRHVNFILVSLFLLVSVNDMPWPHSLYSLFEKYTLPNFTLPCRILFFTLEVTPKVKYQITYNDRVGMPSRVLCMLLPTFSKGIC